MNKSDEMFSKLAEEMFKKPGVKEEMNEASDHMMNAMRTYLESRPRTTSYLTAVPNLMTAIIKCWSCLSSYLGDSTNMSIVEYENHVDTMFEMSKKALKSDYKRIILSKLEHEMDGDKYGKI